ncbi:hypothetical protein [Breznakia pachnodae]|uniref:Uncharacterized protein n=1 Tax=Breznakia pachnodae TaxID=265178 RepID=A0ABU0E6Q4_9FIRM|nr:hypothetical protein [Breznakia pachnodae]MDQ0362572.1 hypothetical protein [Breznakia pachnodae]
MKLQDVTEFSYAALWSSYLDEVEVYLKRMNATDEERLDVYEWVNEGNDFMNNGDYIYKEDGSPADYITALRLFGELRKEKLKEKKMKEFNYELFKTSLENANRAILGLKRSEPGSRFRMETCVNKESVKIYVINKGKVTRIITITGPDIEIENKSESEGEL